MSYPKSFYYTFFLIIFGPFFTLNVAINKTGSLLLSSNNVDIGKTSGRENTVTVAKKTSDKENTIAMEFDIKNEEMEELKKGDDSAIKNEEVRELNENAKIGLEV